jgi:predicted GNAT family acetyltransferase
MRIEHQHNKNRYVLLEEEKFLGELEYDQQDTTLVLLRVEVPPELRGEGHAAYLVKGVLEAIEAQGGLKVRPVCPYIAKYMMKNKEFDHLRA